MKKYLLGVLVVANLAVLIAYQNLPFLAGSVIPLPFGEDLPSQEEQDQLFQKQGLMPLLFEKNQGQSHSDIRYRADNSGYQIGFKENEVLYALTRRIQTEEGQQHARLFFRQQFLDASPDAIVGENLQTTKINSFVGNNPDKWQTDIPTYEQIRYQSVYPGIDLVYRGQNSQLKYDFVVAPGARYQDIRLSYQTTSEKGDATAKLSVSEEGNLVVTSVHCPAPLEACDLIEHKPYAYQVIDGNVVERAAEFTLENSSSYSFRVVGVDSNYELVIDPEVTFSQPFGGAASDSAEAVAVDISGRRYIAGQTASDPFLDDDLLLGDFVNNPAISLAFVARLSAANAIDWVTRIGGDGVDAATDLAVASDGVSYITGYTSSSNFPTFVGSPFQTIYGGGAYDHFAFSLSEVGNLLSSSYLGGEGNEVIPTGQISSKPRIAIEEDGGGVGIDTIYVSGTTPDTAFDPNTLGFENDPNLIIDDPENPISSGNYHYFIKFIGEANDTPSYYNVMRIGPDGYSLGLDLIPGTDELYFTGMAGNFDNDNEELDTTPGAFATTRNNPADIQAAYFGILDVNGNLISEIGAGYLTYLHGYLDGRTLTAVNPNTQTIQGDVTVDQGTGIAYLIFGGVPVTAPTLGAYDQDPDDSDPVPDTNNLDPAEDNTSNRDAADTIIVFDPEQLGPAQLIYSTFWGTPFTGDLAIAWNGTDIYFTGSINAGGGFYFNGGSLQEDHGGGSTDAYIVRLNPGQNGGDSADDLVYSSYLGGSSDDNGRDLAVIDAENVLIVGDTASAANGAFLGTGAAFPGAMGGVNAFFTVYDTTTQQNFQATAANPVPYAQNVSTSTTPTITFDVAPTVNSANAEVKLFSQWHGRLLFSSTVNNNVLTLTPDQNTPFRSGDTVLVTMDENALTTADTRALIETQLYKLSFASAQAPATFPSKTDYDLTNPGQDVKLADVDADGDLDVLVMTDTNIEVHLNNGSGVFAAGNSFGPDNQAVAPGSIAIGDLNEDGIPDVFIAGADEQAYTFLGNGNATFTQNSILANDLEGASFDAGPAELTDVDHDGDLDVVMMLTNISIPGSPGGYIIFLNDGNGTLSAGNNLVAGSNGLNFTLADVDADGELSAVSVNNNQNNVTLNTADGDNFDAAVNIDVNGINSSTAIVAIDIDGGGNQEVAVANDASNSVTFLGYNGNTLEALGGNIEVGTNPLDITAADFNGDGIMDLATANNGSNNITIIIRDGVGDITTSNFTTGTSPRALEAGDLNGDGIVDLVTAGGELSVLLGNSTTPAAAPAATSNGRSMRRINASIHPTSTENSAEPAPENNNGRQVKPAEHPSAETPSSAGEGSTAKSASATSEEGIPSEDEILKVFERALPPQRSEQQNVLEQIQAIFERYFDNSFSR